MGFFSKKPKYVRNLEKERIFNNTFENKIPQTMVAKLCEEHAKKGKKVLVLAFDAVRPDSLLHIVASDDKERYPHSEKAPGSGISMLKDEGGLYFSYAGGEPEDKSTWQETSTIPGFATLLSGKWGFETGVVTNNDGFNFSADTFLLRCAQMGKKASFNAAWDAFFTCLFAKEKEMDLEKYKFNQSTCDYETYCNVEKSILSGDDVIFGIFENPDNNGHRFIFRNENHAYVKAVVDSDRYAGALIETAKRAFPDEDWLFVITTDHGGHMYRHGTRKITDVLTFLATNEKL